MVTTYNFAAKMVATDTITVKSGGDMSHTEFYLCCPAALCCNKTLSDCYVRKFEYHFYTVTEKAVDETTLNTHSRTPKPMILALGTKSMITNCALGAVHRGDDD